MTEKTRYTDDELQEFKEIILKNWKRPNLTMTFCVPT